LLLLTRRVDVGVFLWLEAGHRASIRNGIAGFGCVPREVERRLAIGFGVRSPVEKSARRLESRWQSSRLLLVVLSFCSTGGICWIPKKRISVIGMKQAAVLYGSASNKSFFVRGFHANGWKEFTEALLSKLIIKRMMPTDLAGRLPIGFDTSRHASALCLDRSGKTLVARKPHRNNQRLRCPDGFDRSTYGLHPPSVAWHFDFGGLSGGLA